MRILICSWRDCGHPEGGGSEFYVEGIARGLAGLGHEVTIATAGYGAASSDEIVAGVRFIRRGSKFSVYLYVLLGMLLRRYGRVDHVIDVQNGVPFFTPLVTRRPVTVVVHHTHREQWPIVHPGPLGRIGWFIESRISPRLYHWSRYVTVSEASRTDLNALGVSDERIDVIRNWRRDSLTDRQVARASEPRVCVVGRLVPHKQVEHAIDAVAALATHIHGIHLDVVGDGWWREELVEHARRRGVHGRITFHGEVTDRARDEVYARSWVLALPSLKEGWGLVVTEAGRFGTPAVAYRSAGGTTESIMGDRSGLLVDSPQEFTAALASIIEDARLRQALGAGARRFCGLQSFTASLAAFAAVIENDGRGATGFPNESLRQVAAQSM